MYLLPPLVPDPHPSPKSILTQEPKCPSHKSGDPLLHPPPGASRLTLRRRQVRRAGTAHLSHRLSFLPSIISYHNSFSSCCPTVLPGHLPFLHMPGPLFPQRFFSGCALAWNEIQPGTYVTGSLAHLFKVVAQMSPRSTLFKPEPPPPVLPFSLPCLIFLSNTILSIFLHKTFHFVSHLLPLECKSPEDGFCLFYLLLFP